MWQRQCKHQSKGMEHRQIIKPSANWWHFYCDNSAPIITPLLLSSCKSLNQFFCLDCWRALFVQSLSLDNHQIIGYILFSALKKSFYTNFSFHRDFLRSSSVAVCWLPSLKQITNTMGLATKFISTCCTTEIANFKSPPLVKRLE